MKDHPDFQPVDMESITDEHHSDKVFPDLELPEGIKPAGHEWQGAAGFLPMACGCVCEVFFGDTVWFLPGDDPDSLVAVAVDPATLH